MKASIVALVGAALITSSPWSVAASRVDLNLKGHITPSACLPALSQDGLVDYGKIAVKDLSADTITLLPRVTLQLSVSCESQTLFALNARDNRKGSANGTQPYHYGLGLINGNQKLGKYQIDVFNPVADSLVYPLFSFDYGTTWLVNAFGSFMGPDYWNAFGDTPTPKALRSVAVDLRITTSIAATRELTLTEDVPLDGSATLDLIYL